MNHSNIRHHGRHVRNIYFNGNVNKTSVLPTYSWEKELGLSGILHTSQYAKRARNLTSTPRRNRKHLNFVQNVVDNYCENTSLHGFKYITTTDNTLLEKVMWFFICFGAILGTVFFLKPVFEKYFARAVLTTIAETGAGIWNVPFPAVTICNVNKASKSLIAGAAEKSPWSNCTVETIRQVIDFMAMFGQIPVDKPVPVREEVVRCADEHNQDIDTLMREVTQPLHRLALKCWWIGKRVNCSQIFRLARTDEGYCWSFNSAPMHIAAEGATDHDGPDADDNVYRDTGALQEPEFTAWEIQTQSDGHMPTFNFENEDFDTSNSPLNEQMGKRRPKRQTTDAGSGENTDPDRDSFTPLRVNGAGPNMGLTVMLNPDVAEYHSNTNNVHGFKVLIHHPDDFPSVAIKAFLANAGREIFVPVTVTQTSSSSDIQHIPDTQRTCRFYNEVNLKFYKEFRYSNCFLQCQVLSMNKTCGCVPYVYAALHGVNICDFKGMSCVNNRTAKFSSLSPDKDIPGLNSSHDSMVNCHCPSDCEDVIYMPEVSSATFPKYPDSITLPIDAPKEKLTLLRIYFKELGFVAYSRDLLYGTDDLIAAFGGIVSLFLGFSFVSAAELVYFLMIRPALHYSYYMDGKT